MRASWIGALSLLVTLCLSAGSAAAKVYSFAFSDTLEVEDGSHLSLQLRYGNVIVSSGDDDFIIIEATKRVEAVNMDDAAITADHVEVDVQHKDREISIETQYRPRVDYDPDLWDKIIGADRPSSESEIDYRITVPSVSDVSIMLASGEVLVQNIIGTVAVRSSAADIELNTIEGAVEIENGGGDVQADLLFGPVTIRQPEGTINLRWVDGDIRLKSLSAAISIVQESGSIDLTSISSEVSIQTNLDSGREFLVETESGDIQFSVPATSSGSLKIGSQLGEIRTDIPISISEYSRYGVAGNFGEGGVKVTLQSGSGDVSVANF